VAIARFFFFFSFSYPSIHAYNVRGNSILRFVLLVVFLKHLADPPPFPSFNSCDAFGSSTKPRPLLSPKFLPVFPIFYGHGITLLGVRKESQDFRPSLFLPPWPAFQYQCSWFLLNDAWLRRINLERFAPNMCSPFAMSHLRELFCR